MTIGSDTGAAPARSSSLWQGALARLARRAPSGSITLHFPDGSSARALGVRPGPAAVVHVASPRFLLRMWAGGALGFAEAYMEGDCDTPDLGAVLAWALANETELARTLGGGPAARLATLLHRLRPNTRAGSRRNIHRHYDLGNDFYAAWLDPTMTYSAGWFGGNPALPLASAQHAKYARLAAMAGIRTDDQVLEVGCGWGGFAEWAAREIGCRVTAITISAAQHAFARRRIAEAGLSDLVDIRLVDYRDVEGTYDRIVSIEMMEAVGERFWPTYAGVLRDRLRPGGRAALQVITIDEARYGPYRRRADFIQAYVFPGGMLPTAAAVDATMAGAGLVPAGGVGFGPDYAETLRRWRTAFEGAWPSIRSQGFDERFRRLWRYYLAYCEAGFDSGRIDVRLFAYDRP